MNAGMTKDRIRFCVAIGRVAGARAEDRAPKSAQRAVVVECRAKLRSLMPDLPDADMSVSHSRGWCVVIAAHSANGPEKLPGLGVDVEYAEPARDWSRLVGYLSEQVASSIAPLHGAMVWTSYEAVFKASGIWPSADEIRSFVSCCAAPLSDGDQVAHRCGDTHIMSLPLPQDNRFAFSIAFQPSEQPGADIVIEWHEVPCVNH